MPCGQSIYYLGTWTLRDWYLSVGFGTGGLGLSVWDLGFGAWEVPSYLTFLKCPRYMYGGGYLLKADL